MAPAAEGIVLLGSRPSTWVFIARPLSAAKRRVSGSDGGAEVKSGDEPPAAMV